MVTPTEQPEPIADMEAGFVDRLNPHICPVLDGLGQLVEDLREQIEGREARKVLSRRKPRAAGRRCKVSCQYRRNAQRHGQLELLTIMMTDDDKKRILGEARM